MIVAKTVAAHTLGCKVNQQETEAVLEFFRLQGYSVRDFAETADVYLINTCTVTHLGDRKSRQMIRRARRQNPHALVVVMGCYAQRAPDEIMEIPGVDLIVGNQDRAQIMPQLADLLAAGGERGKPLNLVQNIGNARTFEELPLSLERNRIRAQVKVQDGCNQFCTYCIVPYTRGPVRSRPAERVVDEVSQLVAAGFAEIVLTGIHTSAYGLEWRDEKGHPNLADLVQLILERVPGLRRLRISSLEPTEIPEALLEIMVKSPVLCRHLHIPLQSGDDQILREMHRPYTAGQYLNIVERLRKEIPGLAITTDVMVGFPGETEAHFQRSYDSIQELGFSDLHVFKYSPRTGTPAAAFKEQVPAKVKESRSQRLLALTSELKLRFAAQFAGKTLTVLLEEETELLNSKGGVLDGMEQGEPVKLGGSAIRCWIGYTDNYLRVAIPTADRLGSTKKPLSAGNLSPAHEPLFAGSLVSVILQPGSPEFSWGRLIESTEI